jgi:hypothetical protein
VQEQEGEEGLQARGRGRRDGAAVDGDGELSEQADLQRGLRDENRP